MDEYATTLLKAPFSIFLYLVLIVTTCVFLIVQICPKLSKQNPIYTLFLRSLRHTGGPLPKHVAFIMDGNRRWARRLNLPPSKGHPQGGEKLIESLQWCLEAGIHTVTVYAFSVENFKRSREEIEEIMSLAQSTFYRFQSSNHILHQHKVRIRFWGDWNFFSPELRAIMTKLVTDSSIYTNGPVVNICFGYASRYDIANSVKEVISLSDEIDVNDIDHRLIKACLSSGVAKGCFVGHDFISNNIHDDDDHKGLYPDLLIRTSGETRLSDFLLWESSHCMLSFYPALWPDFSVWDFVKILLQYQKNVRLRDIYYSSLHSSTATRSSSPSSTNAQDKAIAKIAEKHIRSITQTAS